ncbi:5'-nucleotidase C-terminal domain-containing protein [Pedobacter glucosidilyticus]|uniref:5'-nucleotidase C-terminal domain-containing protein n=1 Tax=Pedobacter glucosidilyticus TaxID=1122941 RepID=UPI0003F960F5|nr:5'-nucleotidase C-terminal domain-containing protein [Pedobacter glucosidilyticus]
MKFKLLIVAFALLLLQACGVHYQVKNIQKQIYPVSADFSADTTLSNFYKPYKQQLDSIMNDIVAVSAQEIQKGKPEAPLNNFFADAMYVSAKSKNIQFDFAYTNYGGLRTSLPKGNIPRYKIFELMPFENAFATATFSGQNIKEFFNFIANSGGEPISGATFTIENGKASDIKINGEPINLEKNYTVLTSDYMINGGDGGEIFTKALSTKVYEYKLREGLLDYLATFKNNNQILNPVKDGRIKLK